MASFSSLLGSIRWWMHVQYLFWSTRLHFPWDFLMSFLVSLMSYGVVPWGNKSILNGWKTMFDMGGSKFMRWWVFLQFSKVKHHLRSSWDRCSKRSCLHHPPCSVLSALGCVRDFTHLININEFGDTFLCRMTIADWSWCVEKPHSWAAAAAAPVANKHRSLPRGDVVCNSGISLRTKFLRKSNWIVGSCFFYRWLSPAWKRWLVKLSLVAPRTGSEELVRFLLCMVRNSFSATVEPKSGTI